MKIAIANDSPLAVEMLRRTLGKRPEHEIIWIVENGQQAVEQTRWQRPDLLLMDIQMPVMDGVEATRQIMRQHPCTILVVTFDVGVNASRVFDAMAAGAIDAVDTPAPTEQAAQMTSLLLVKIDLIGRQHRHNVLTSGAMPPIIDTYARHIETESTGTRNTAGTGRMLAPDTRRADRSAPDRLVAIGASAGGPMALARLLAGIPADYAAAIVIVQHLDHQFAG